MKTRLLILLAIAAGSIFTAQADETIVVLNVGSQVYSNVTVTSVSATDVFFTYSGGMGNAKLKKLSPEWQKHFNYDPAKAQAAEQKRAENKAIYHDQLLRQPDVKPPSEEIIPPKVQPKAVWLDDYSSALSQAQSEGKPLLIAFTGTDWCVGCIQFDKDVLSTEQFAAYAQSKLVLLQVDILEHTHIDPGLANARGKIVDQFHVTGFPAYVLVDGDGRELGRQTGYKSGGPTAFIKRLEGFAKR